jgi:hypothetical protein
MPSDPAGHRTPTLFAKVANHFIEKLRNRQVPRVIGVSQARAVRIPPRPNEERRVFQRDSLFSRSLRNEISCASARPASAHIFQYLSSA